MMALLVAAVVTAAAPVSAQNCPVVLDFDVDGTGTPLAAGEAVEEAYAAQGVHLSVWADASEAVAGLGIRFDSASPTGGDFDLGTPNQDFGGPGLGSGGHAGQPGENALPLHGLLIKAENTVDGDGDGLVDDPDDDFDGAFLRFDFDQEACVFGFDLVDIDSSAAQSDIWVLDAAGATLLHRESTNLGDNSVETIELGICGARTLAVALYSGGALDNLALCPGGSAEVCDAADNDGDGQVDEEPDLDGDGWSDCGDDCDDNDDTAWPGAPEVCDGQDDDCDGVVPADEIDGDGDGVAPCGGDCEDGDPSVFPSAPEVCNGLDDDCDGQAGTAFETPAPTAWTWRSDRMRGHKWLMSSTVDLGGMSVLLDAWAGDPITFLVYEGADEQGPFVHVASAATHATGSGPAWHQSPPMAVTLTEGGWYLLVVHWSATVGYGSSEPSFPLTSPYGEVVSGVYQNWVWSPPVTAWMDANIYAYAMRHFFLDEIDSDGDGSPLCADCDDDQPDTWPGAPELCDELDDDCDGLVPPDEVDGDGDGELLCAGDCDDDDPTVHSDGVELCDGLDNDCDGAPGADPDGEVDADADGSLSCDDCDDSRPAAFPGNPEICDGVDNDCSGSPDFDASGEVDADSDGSLSCLDCDDGDGANAPGNPEVCDGADNDCDGLPDADDAGEVDDDGDGALSCLDCDDAQPLAFPGNVELCDGLDNDCDGVSDADPAGEVDADGDGHLSCADCDDGEATAWPGNPEICDGIDNDCDPDTDELVDGDHDGFTVCGLDCDDDDPTVHPEAVEVCDGIDNDCDSESDETRDGDGDGASACEGDCDDDDPDVHPDADEFCDGLDGDCDGELPEDEADVDDDGWMICEGDCDDEDPGLAPDGIEARDISCEDGLDNDCDGWTDEDDPDCVLLEDGPLGDGGCQSECDGAGVRFGARTRDRLLLAFLFLVALVRREPPGGLAALLHPSGRNRSGGSPLFADRR
jgi:hypothetical protein